MHCSCCGPENINDLDNTFGAERARKDAKRYLKKGLDGRAKKLIAHLLGKPDNGSYTVLDIGCGAGGLHHELLRQGVARHVTGVDAASAFLEAAKTNANALNLSDAVTYHHRDFAQQHDDIDPADIVTLDRVICCYPHLEQLLGAAAQRASHYLVLSFPVESWWLRLAFRLVDGLLTLFGSGYHPYVHPHAEVVEIARQAGLQPVHRDRSNIWQIMVFERTA